MEQTTHQISNIPPLAKGLLATLGILLLSVIAWTSISHDQQDKQLLHLSILHDCVNTGVWNVVRSGNQINEDKYNSIWISCRENYK